MLEKFRGTLYGVLVGDCFGALFQESSILPKGSRLVLRQFLDSLDKTSTVGLRKSYTDDTALTIAVARTINQFKHIDQKTLAVNFVEEFYKNVNRGFTPQSMEIFAKLKYTNCDDVLFPAKETIRDHGGDNGCAMYIAPIALSCSKNGELNLNEEIRKAIAVTHCHDMAINGAILLGNGIHSLVKMDGQLEIDAFLKKISNSLSSSNQTIGGPSYSEQLQQIKKLLNVENPSEERIVNVLGHSPQALYSVPTAIYCFLRGVKYPNEVNPFRQAIEHAIILGGHSNTITSMTGALCGAYYGESVISQNMLKQCEGLDTITELSENLYKC